MTGKRRKRGITPWKKTALKVCVFWLLLAGCIHLFRIWKAAGLEDQREAHRWGSEDRCAQVSAFLPSENALTEEKIRDLEYKINTALAQDSIKLTAQGEDARLWQDCYSGTGELTLEAEGKSVTVEAVGTGGAFFTFHPLELSSGSYYISDSPMKDEILLDQETAWKLFGSFNVEGRTVRVQDMYLHISGVYHREQGSLYEKGGLPDYVVFVQYKTLLQYGGKGAGADATGYGAGILRTALRPAARASEGQSPSAEGGQPGSGTENDGTGQNDSGQGDSAENTQNMENVGTSNTSYKDTGKITTYEIVMPDPVEGYAAATVGKALGTDSGAIVVDNTNRFGERNLLKDLRDFALLGMRTRNVRYPYWENVAVGWETVFAALFLLECILIALTILLLLWMVIHWYRNKAWTIAGSIRDVQDGIYERQSRRKYPEYYREREESEEEDNGTSQKAIDEKEKGMLEDKGAEPFERIPENRKAVQYETKDQNDQRGSGGSAGAHHDGMRRW